MTTSQDLLVTDLKLTKRHARKVLSIVDQGLSRGLGIAEPGKMCVEAAVCYALGLPHGDDPKCVAKSVRSFKIALNDSCDLKPMDRAKLLRRLAIAQLGSNVIDQTKFSRLLAEKATRRIVPLALRAAAKVKENAAHKTPLLEAATRCENEGTKKSAEHAIKIATAATAASIAASYAAIAAAYAASAASYASYAASYASYAASYASYAAIAAAYAASAAAYAASADAAANAANAANAASKRKFFQIAADIGVEALQECDSPGCKWLDLCDE